MCRLFVNKRSDPIIEICGVLQSQLVLPCNQLFALLCDDVISHCMLFYFSLEWSVIRSLYIRGAVNRLVIGKISSSDLPLFVCLFVMMCSSRQMLF